MFSTVNWSADMIFNDLKSVQESKSNKYIWGTPFYYNVSIYYNCSSQARNQGSCKPSICKACP
jgi:hypothetical protein